jgi:hypothetical protein
MFFRNQKYACASSWVSELFSIKCLTKNKWKLKVLIDLDTKTFGDEKRPDTCDQRQYSLCIETHYCCA